MFTFVYNLITRSLVVLLISMLSVNYLPNNLFNDFPLEPKSMESNNYDSVIPQWNSKLSDSKPEYIQLNQILGPESIAIDSNSGFLYTGLADGRLVELDPSKNYKLREVLRLKQSPKCSDNVATKANDCGRILQVRFKNNTLFALDAYTGLYKVDIKSGSKTLIGPKPLTKVVLYNSFVFDEVEPNLVYLTVSSTRWNLLQIVWSFMELESTGQIVALDIRTGKRVIVLDQLMTPNGIDMDVARDRVVFSQTAKGQISSIHLKQVREAFKKAKDGDKLTTVSMEVLIPLVPGLPDNIVIQGDIAYIALPFVKPNGKELIDHLSTMPNVRKAYGRLIFGLGKMLQYVGVNFYNHPLLESTYSEITSGHINYRLMQSDKSGLIKYNLATGASQFYGSNTFSFLSEAVPDSKGNLLLGSFRSPFIVKVKL